MARGDRILAITVCIRDIGKLMISILLSATYFDLRQADLSTCHSTDAGICVSYQENEICSLDTVDKDLDKGGLCGQQKGQQVAISMSPSVLPMTCIKPRSSLSALDHKVVCTLHATDAHA